MLREEIVISIPHSGTEIPQDIRKLIAHADHLLANESDLFTDQIFSVGGGVKTITTPFSRIIADPNRAPDEIYTEGSARALGVVMLGFAKGGNVFEQDPTLEQMRAWVDRFHRPYHEKLTEALKTSKFLIDGHSLWSHGAPGHFGGSGERADIVLGNQYFCTCSAETTHFFKEHFEKAGFSVAINDPYPGRYIIGTHCSRLGLRGIQIEINRKLYMNEDTHEPNAENIAQLRSIVSSLVDSFCAWDEANHGKRVMTDLSN